MFLNIHKCCLLFTRSCQMLFKPAGWELYSACCEFFWNLNCCMCSQTLIQCSLVSMFQEKNLNHCPSPLWWMIFSQQLFIFLFFPMLFLSYQVEYFPGEWISLISHSHIKHNAGPINGHHLFKRSAPCWGQAGSCLIGHIEWSEHAVCPLW